MDLNSLWAPAATLIAGVVWAVRQEGKINVHEERFKRHEDKFAAQDKISTLQSTDIIARLERIERKQDTSIVAANGNHAQL